MRKEGRVSEPYLDVKEVCALLKVDARLVYQEVHAGRLPVVRLGKQGRVWRFRREDVLNLQRVSV